MPPGKTLPGAGGLSIVAAALACVLVPGSASAAVGRPSEGTLSSRLAQLAKPSVRSLPPARQARLLSLARSGPGSLMRRGNRVLVDVRFDHGATAGIDDLRAAGAQVANVSRRYQTVTVAAKPAELRSLAAVPRVVGVTEVLTPLVYASTCPQGIAISEGDEQLRATEARETFGVDGSGVTVGILSDSFDKATQAADGSGPVETHAKEDIESGDLPGGKNSCPGQEAPVGVLEEFSPAEPGEEAADEGRAMAQIVHDLAPGASLAFATAFFESQIPFAENIELLAKPVIEGGAAADVIVDDVAYFDEPFFQEGPVGIAVSNVTADGVAYFSSAGNNNLIDASGRDIASWETPKFRDSGNCPSSLVALSEEIEEVEGPGTGLNPHHCVDFNPGPGVDTTFGITVSSGAVLIADLQWAEPWEGVNADVDAYLLDSNGQVVGGSIEDNVGVSQKPFELVGWENESLSSAEVRLVINSYTGVHTPRLKFMLLENGGGVTATEYPESAGGDIVGPTIFGHNGGKDALSIGAIRYSTTSAPERFSSRGPVSHYFEPADGAGPAEPLASPEVLSKPDVVATDCGVTTFFAFEVGEVWRFCGTSAAAPHAAAVAALMLDREPTATPERIESLLRASAVPVGSFGPCAIGGGLVDAVGAIEELESPVVIGPAACTQPVSPPPEEVKEAEELIQAANPPATATPLPPHVPRTFFRRHPRKLIRTRHRKARVVFRFGSNEEGVSFICRVDGGLSRFCGERLARRFRVGRHSLRVVARDADGNFDQTPAVFRFRVKRIG